MIRLVEQCELDDDRSRKKLIQNNQITLINFISNERRVNIFLLHLSTIYHSLLEVIMSLDNEYCANENDAIIIHFWRLSCAHDAVMSYAHREMIVKHLVFHQASTWWDSQWSNLNLLCNILLRTLLICRIRNDRNLITKSLHDRVHNDRNQICCVTLINITISSFSIEFDTTYIIYIVWNKSEKSSSIEMYE